MNRFILTISWGLVVQAALAQSFVYGQSASTSLATPSASGPSSALAHSLDQAFADVYEKVSPGVVVIEAQQAPLQPPAGATGSPLMQFFQQDPSPRNGALNQGSGFVITSDGFILTNSHVLEGASPDGLRVTLKDGRKFEAKVAGIDPDSDLAVLKINASNLPVLEFGDSDRMRVGEFAFALGAPYDLRYTFTYGILSAKGRTDLSPRQHGYAEYLQTDAAINPGNSGGPLVDIDGRVVGVNTMIYGIDQGLGFAIPINLAKKVAGELISNGRAVRGWLGIAIKDLSDEPGLAQQFPAFPKGILVQGIYSGTPASQSDLRPADIITSVDGVAVGSPLELQKLIFDKKVGEEVELGIWRNSGATKVKLRTAEHVENVMPVVNQLNNPGAPVDPAQGGDSSADQPPQPTAPESQTAGLEMRTMTADLAMAMKLPAQEGVLITDVQPGSPASAAGLQPGDVVTAVGSAPVRTKKDFVKALQSGSGDSVMLTVSRGDQKAYAFLKF